MSNHTMITRSKRKRLNNESSDEETTDSELFESDEPPEETESESESSPLTLEDVLLKLINGKTGEPNIRINESELDKQYEELSNTRQNIDETDYFKSLTDNAKTEIIEQVRDIQYINDSSKPLKFKILESDMDINTKSIALKQIEKIRELDPSSGEYSKMDQWINGLIRIPINIYSKLPIDIASSKRDKQLFLKNTYNTLNRAIYGHKQAKTHILQVISKWIQNPSSSGNILALQGPMGNGKTTLVKEGIAKAIDRPFAFIALGGASDSCYFDGHNFTYEGSRWGRIVDVLMKSKCMNPIIYFDELDKISDSSRGREIVHLLTHLTDHSQNDRFSDNYFSGIELDLSKALFIFSFNHENLVDPILRDRMYVINTSGFKTSDKIEISNNYLLPELLKTYMYTDKIIFTDEILTYIIENHTGREEGVRNLKRCLETVISKVNMYELLYNEDDKTCEIDLPYELKNYSNPYRVNRDDLKELLDKKKTDSRPEHMYL